MDALYLWLQSHTALLGPVIALAACLESLVGIGILLPGVAILFALAVIGGAAELSIYPLLLWGAFGAVLGDGVSFLIGYYGADRIERYWPFSKNLHWLTQGQHFFERYGILSVVVGRFIGPIRPVIPTVAGMMGMPMAVFFIVNALSALVWSPVYLLPGYFTGMAVSMHEYIPRELLYLFALLLSAILVLPMLGDWLWHRLQLTWRSSLVVAACALLMSLTVQYLNSFDALNYFVHQWLLTYQQPWLTHMMAWLTYLGDSAVLVVIGASLFLLQYSVKQWRAGLVIPFMGIVLAASVWLAKWLFSVTRPDMSHSLGWDSFPSGHTAAATYVACWAAMMFIRRYNVFSIRWLFASSAGLWIAVVALSRLVLQVHWAGDVITGFCFGLCVAIVAYKWSSQLLR